MKLYVNGDSHSAGAEAVNACCFADDDYNYKSLGRKPHPDNLAVSWGARLAEMMSAELVCDAESASSNDRIIRTTLEYLDNHSNPDYVVIGWSTWEREEWFYKGQYWQINAGGIGKDWPPEIVDRYKKWIEDIDYEQKKQQDAEKIWDLHYRLFLRRIPHLFFNCYKPLYNGHDAELFSWGQDYIEPYNNNFTYYDWCRAQGFTEVNSKSYHYGPDAHQAWARFLFNFMVQKELNKT